VEGSHLVLVDESGRPAWTGPLVLAVTVPVHLIHTAKGIGVVTD
jgi:ribonuclease HII